jgi:hypothetical protein
MDCLAAVGDGRAFDAMLAVYWREPNDWAMGLRAVGELAAKTSWARLVAWAGAADPELAAFGLAGLGATVEALGDDGAAARADALRVCPAHIADPEPAASAALGCAAAAHAELPRPTLIAAILRHGGIDGRLIALSLLRERKDLDDGDRRALVPVLGEEARASQECDLVSLICDELIDHPGAADPKLARHAAGLKCPAKSCHRLVDALSASGR